VSLPIATTAPAGPFAGGMARIAAAVAAATRETA
jgi:hypothetical protein